MCSEATTTSPFSLCSIDADGSIYEEEEENRGETEIVGYAKEIAIPCSNLASSPTQTIAANLAHSFLYSAGTLAAAIDKSTVPSSQSRLDRKSSEHPHSELFTLEAALLSQSSSPLEVPYKISPSSYPSNLADAAAVAAVSSSIDIDLGSNEEVSNAELHSLELEYQQEQFEEIQKGRNQHNRVPSFDTATLYSVCPTDWNTDTMTSFESKSMLQQKRVTIDQMVASRNRRKIPLSSNLTKEVGSSSIPIHSSKSVPSASRKTSNGLIDSDNSQASGAKKLKRHSICLSQLPSLKTKLDDETAAKVLKAIVDSQDYQLALEEGHEISVEIYDGDKDVFLGQCDSRQHKEAKTQTMEKTYYEQMIETEKEPAIQRYDVETQIEAPLRKDVEMQSEEPNQPKQKFVPLKPFDESPRERCRASIQSKMEIQSTLDLSVITKSVCKDEASIWSDVTTNWDNSTQQDFSTQANILQDLGLLRDVHCEEKGAQTERHAVQLGNQFVGEGELFSILCSSCQQEISATAIEDESVTLQESSQGDLKDSLAIEQTLDEAEAAIALKSLQCQEILSLGLSAKEVIQKPPTVKVHAQMEERKDLEKAKDDEESNLQSETVIEECLAQIPQQEEVQIETLKRSLPDSETEKDDSACHITQMRKRGGNRKSQQQKEEEQRIRSQLSQYYPLRRTGRQKQKVDYSEKARRDKPMEQSTKLDARTMRSRKRLAEMPDVSQESTRHPKKKWKNSKTML